MTNDESLQHKIQHKKEAVIQMEQTLNVKQTEFESQPTTLDIDGERGREWHWNIEKIFEIK